jgi:soluble lytic murein transglycosylase
MTTSPRRSLAALRAILLLAALGGGVFWLSTLAARQPQESEPTAPARVFTLPEVVLAQPSPEARATAALALGKPEDVRRILKAEMAKAQEPSLGRLRYLLAKATPDIQEARPWLDALAKSQNLLAKWGRLRLAERLRDVDPDVAAENAGLLLAEPLLRARAEQLLALSLYAAHRHEEAEPMLRSLLSEAPERSAAVNITLPLATIVAAKPDLDSQKYALSLYRRILTRAPVGDAADQARVAVQTILASLPAGPQRTVLSQLSADQAFAEAEALESAHEYTRAAERYSAIAQRFKGDPKSVCDARLGQGKAFFSAKKSNEALVVFEDVARLCPNPDHCASAHFQAGRVLLRRGDPRGAIGHYDAIAHEFPGHKLADDALLAAANAFQDLNDTDAARTRLRQLLALSIHGDVRPDARFLLGWLERADGHYAAALAEFDQQLLEGTGEKSEDIIGRTEYWRARTLLGLNRREDAEEALIRLFKARPLSYYGQQALSRLEDLDAPLAPRLIAELREEKVDEPPAETRSGRPDAASEGSQGDGSRQDAALPTPLRLAARPELNRPEFQRAIELLRVAEPGFAVEELQSLGCFLPNSPDDLYLLCASLLSEFGADSHATTLARKRTTRVLAQTPKGQALAQLRVVYPRAFSGLVEDAAKRSEVPAAFVRAIAREESSFDPRAVSPADAYGLVQLIRPTAKAHAGPLRLPSDIESLKNPEINLRVGAAFMRALFDRFKINPGIVPAAYNAGPGAADKWLRERGRLSFDEWVETIPYTETRRYTRRVLQSYGAYAWLDEGRIPPLPRELVPPTPAVATREPEAKKK